MPPTRGISCLSLVLYGIRISGFHKIKPMRAKSGNISPRTRSWALTASLCLRRTNRTDTTLAGIISSRCPGRSRPTGPSLPGKSQFQIKALKVTILGISCLSKCLYGICEGANEGKESVIGAFITLKHSKRQEMSISVISV